MPQRDHSRCASVGNTPASGTIKIGRRQCRFLGLGFFGSRGPPPSVGHAPSRQGYGTALSVLRGVTITWAAGVVLKRRGLKRLAGEGEFGEKRKLLDR
jgi:hypothetical protein